MYKKLSLLLFLIASAGDLLSMAIPAIAGWEFLFKPLLMPALLAYAYHSLSREQRGQKVAKHLFYALGFSFGGDSFLLFDEQYPICFILGLGSFLIAHIHYILAFWQWRGSNEEKGKGEWVKAFPVTLLLVTYGATLYFFLYPELDQVMKIAVLVYASAITLMALQAFGSRFKLGSSSFYAVFGGALLFVGSDSMIAINKFLNPIPQSGLWIMITYIAAQFLIIWGGLKQESKS